MKYRIGRISRALVKMTVDTATVNAQDALNDPWLVLDMEAHQWLSDDTLGEVEEM